MPNTSDSISTSRRFEMEFLLMDSRKTRRKGLDLNIIDSLMIED
jgi:hypothetical protein